MTVDEYTVETEALAADVACPPHPRALVVLTHGAGSDRQSAVLRALAESLVARGLAVARIDLPYRRDRPKGPPSPSKAARDRDGLVAAVTALRSVADGPLIVGGHSYGGRQASMVAAEQPDLFDALLLTSYPLHPPGKPERSRTEHLPDITAPTLIVHGRSDAFGTSAEFAEVLTRWRGPVRLLEVAKADHSLRPDRSGVGELTADAVVEWLLPAAQARADAR
ncbi:alpha/beta hydrolase family protein [Gordonia aichiensis]|uniref:alpha/beta hydrolase family protein n=1 Tax=Gordonia aichiensis TaxID=36820 RepID=UPI00326500AC